MTEFIDKLNEPQRESLDQLRLTLLGSRHSDVRVRKDGQDHWFEVDWLRDALDHLCGGPHSSIGKRTNLIETADRTLTGADGPEIAAPPSPGSK